MFRINNPGELAPYATLPDFSDAYLPRRDVGFVTIWGNVAANIMGLNTPTS